MKNKFTYSWSIPSHITWGSWDYGEVRASNREEAIALAKKALKKNISKMNEALSAVNHDIDVDYDAVEVELFS